jgi:8-oxo-dGTP pyrophosphatase MutT (NUDIX family)
VGLGRDQGGLVSAFWQKEESDVAPNSGTQVERVKAVVRVPALMRYMERYRTMRVYSAGGVVFRLSRGVINHAPTEMNHAPTGDGHIIDQQSAVGSFSGSNEFDGGQLKSTPRDVTIEVALVGRSHPGIWALPKGTPKAGETIEQVAVREVQEETGLQVRLVAYIGSITYWFVRQQVRYHKQVRHFLLEAIGGDIALHDQEYDMVEWFPLYEACRRLTYQNEVNILYQAEDILQRWLRPREGHT